MLTDDPFQCHMLQVLHGLPVGDQHQPQWALGKWKWGVSPELAPPWARVWLLYLPDRQSSPPPRGGQFSGERAAVRLTTSARHPRTGELVGKGTWVAISRHYTSFPLQTKGCLPWESREEDAWSHNLKIKGPSNHQAPPFTAEELELAKAEVSCPASSKQFQES